MLNGKLRLAKVSDLDELLAVILEHVAQIPNGPPPDEEHILKVWRDLIEAPREQAIVILYEVEGVVRGFIGGIVNPNVFTKAKICVELGYYISQEYSSIKAYRELLDTYESWAKEVAKADYVAGATYNERFGIVYERRGYHRTEVSYLKEL